jgi:hypothetical protein
VGTCDPGWPQSAHFVVLAEFVTLDPHCRRRRQPNLAAGTPGPDHRPVAPLYPFHLVFSCCLRPTRPRRRRLRRARIGPACPSLDGWAANQMTVSERPDSEAGQRGRVVAEGGPRPFRIRPQNSLNGGLRRWLFRPFFRHRTRPRRGLTDSSVTEKGGPVAIRPARRSDWAGSSLRTRWPAASAHFACRRRPRVLSGPRSVGSWVQAIRPTQSPAEERPGPSWPARFDP